MWSDGMDKKRGWDGQGVRILPRSRSETRGVGAAADIRNPGKLAAAATDKICLTCHLNQPTHVGRLESSHAKDQVACTACHKIHARRTRTGGAQGGRDQ